MKADTSKSGDDREIRQLQDDQKRLVGALQMLFDLLEEYAPRWYTQKHRAKAIAVLASIECVVHKLQRSYLRRHSALSRASSRQTARDSQVRRHSHVPHIGPKNIDCGSENLSIVEGPKESTTSR
jgi:hypothetical protein